MDLVVKLLHFADGTILLVEEFIHVGALVIVLCDVAIIYAHEKLLLLVELCFLWSVVQWYCLSNNEGIITLSIRNSLKLVRRLR